MYMKNKILTLVLSFCWMISIAQNGVDVQIKIDGYSSDTMLVAYYFAEKQLIHDTLISPDQTNFHWKQDTLVPPGMYLLVTLPDNNFVQALMPGEDQQFNVFIDANDIGNFAIEGSVENQLFLDYVKFLSVQNQNSVDLENSLVAAQQKGEPTDAIEKQLDELDVVVGKYIDEVVAKNPKSITSLFLKSNAALAFPEFQGSDEDKQLQRYLYYKEHYFDNLDFNHPAVIRTPLLDQRISYYLKNLTPQHPDSINESLDVILSKFDHATEGYKYYLSTNLNEYANAKIIGFDAVYVHLAENYYGPTKSPWVDQETLNKIKDNARRVKPVLLGKTGADLTFYKEDGSALKMSDIDYEYLVVLFWAPDCGHCKKSMPDYIEFEKKFREQGVKLLAVCTKLKETEGQCWDYVKEKDMEGFIVVSDPDHKSRFKIKYNVQTTPKSFVLDKDRKILMKNLGGHQLEEVMNEIIAVEKATKKIDSQ